MKLSKKFEFFFFKINLNLKVINEKCLINYKFTQIKRIRILKNMYFGFFKNSFEF